MSTTQLENASLQEASHLKDRRVNIVVRLLAQGLVVVLLMALGWWAMTTLGSDSLQATRYPQYVAGCPLADTRIEKRWAGGGCSKEGDVTRSAHAGREVAHSSMLMEAKGTGKVKPLRELPKIPPSTHLDE